MTATANEISAACDHCGKQYRLKRAALGKQAKCACGNVFIVAERMAPPPAMMMTAAPPMMAVPAPTMEPYPPPPQAMYAAPQAYPQPGFAQPPPATRPVGLIVFMILSAAVLLAGVILPWCSIDTVLDGVQSWNGFGGNGIYSFSVNNVEVWKSPEVADDPPGAILIGLGVIYLAMSFFRFRRWSIIPAVAALGTAVYVAHEVLQWVTREQSRNFGGKSLAPEAGIGIWVLVVGGLLMTAAAVTSWAVAKAPANRSL